MVNIKINGKDYKADENKTIYEALAENGYSIPVFCHDELLKSFGSCRLCLVEVEGKGYVPSCSVGLQEGMSIATINEEVKNLRKMDLELLLSDHYADCIAPCQIACPASIDVQGYTALIGNKRYKEAVKLIKEKVPFPVVLGRVCPHPCEGECRRVLIDEAVSICKLKRTAADIDIFSKDIYIPEKEPDKGVRVAVVGGGPAGLSCAYYLTLKGYSVNLFEALPELGGMLRYGIPEYRLPRDILDKEIKTILDTGVGIKTNTRLGGDFTIDSLKKQGFKAVFLAIGAHNSRCMGIQGEDEDFVKQGIAFTLEMGLRKPVKVGDTVAVVGGGNTAVDCARTSLRLGAKNVIIVYRRSRDEMPASPEEIEAVEHEGIKFLFLSNPVAVLKEDGKRILRCIKMELGPQDESGRRSPVPLKGSEFNLEVDNIFLALGQIPNLEGIDDLFETGRGSLIKVDDSFMTSMEGVFAGGDAVTGAATVVEACAAGRKAGESIACYLEGKKYSQPHVFLSKKKEVTQEEIRDLKKLHPEMPREVQKELKVKERIENFKEVELGLAAEQSVKEASRCLECGCKGFFDCHLQKYATEYRADQEKFRGFFNYDKKDTAHPFIEKDFNKCISCARCIRVCDEVWGLGIWGFVNRGFSVKVEPSFGKCLIDTDCESCGYCVDLCPTGALTEKHPGEKIAPYKTKDSLSICSYCSAGCQFYLCLYGDKIAKVKRRNLDEKAKLSLCYKGKFSYEYIEAPDRNRSFKIKEKGKQKEVAFEEAVKFAASMLLEVREKYGSGALALMASESLTNEELYLLKKLKDSLGIKYFSSFTEFSKDEKISYIYSVWDKISDLEKIKKADFVVSLDKEALAISPVVKASLRQKAKREEKVFILGKYESGLNIKIPEIFIDKGAGDFLSDFDATAAKNAVIVFSYSSITENDLKKLVGIVLKYPNITILPVFDKCNSHGFYYFTQGNRNTGELLEKLESGKIKGMLIFGEDPFGLAKDQVKINKLLGGLDVLVSADLFNTKTLDSSTVSFPLSAIAESGGSFINFEGSIQFAPPAYKGTAPSWKIISGLLNELKAKADYKDIDELFKDMLDKSVEFSKVKLHGLPTVASFVSGFLRGAESWARSHSSTPFQPWLSGAWVKEELLMKKSARIDLRKEAVESIQPVKSKIQFYHLCSSPEARFNKSVKDLNIRF